MAYYRISLTVDTLPARYAGRDVSCSSEMSSKVVSTVQSEGPLPANKHCFSWVARIRTNEITAGGRLFPVRFAYRTSNRSLAILSGYVHHQESFRLLPRQGSRGRASCRFLKNGTMPHPLPVNR